MAQERAKRMLLTAASAFLGLLAVGCGGSAVEAPVVAQSNRSASPAPARSENQGISTTVGVREFTPAPVSPVSYQGISFTCDHDGAQADSQIHPTCMIVPPDAGFLLRLPPSMSAEEVTIDFRRTGDGEVEFDYVLLGDRWRIVPTQPLERGAAYEIVLQVANERPRRISVVVPKIGVLDVFEARISGQPTPERVLVSCNRVDILTGSDRQNLALPDMEQVRSVAAADYDLDGRIDLAVLGTDSRGRPVLHWLRNTSLEGQISFQARRLDLPTELTLAIDVAAIDLGRTGLTDLVVADLTGTLWPLANRLRNNPDGVPVGVPFEAGKSLDLAAAIGSLRELSVQDHDRDGYDDLVVIATRGTAIMAGTAGGLNPREVFPHRGVGAWLVEGGELPSMLVASANSLQRVVMIAPSNWREQPLLDFPVVSTEAVCVSPPTADGSAEVLLAYRDQSEGVVRRFRHLSGRFHDQGGRRVGEIGRINRVRMVSAGRSLLVCAECGLYEMREGGPPARVIGFDSRVVFDQPVQVAVLPPMEAYVLADVDGDGRLDVSGIARGATGHSLEVWLNRIQAGGGLTKAWGTNLREGEFGALVALDVNRDGLSDILLLPATGGRAGELYLSKGHGRLEHAGAGYLSYTPIDSAGPPLAVDLNGDGFADLFWPTPTGSISFSDASLPGERGGLFSADGAKLAPLVHGPTGAEFRLDGRLVVSELDGHRPDIVAVGLLGEGNKSAVAVYRNGLRHGRAGVDFEGRFLEGWFDEVLELATGEFEPGQRGYAAIVRDGHRSMIMVWPRADANPVTVAEVSPGSHGLQVIDIDGDGDSDLAFVPGRRARNMVLYVNDGTGHEFSAATVSSESLAEARISGGPLRKVHLIDLDGDGHPELLGIAQDGDTWHSSSSGAGGR